jgi:hypothetical protein
MVEPPETMRPPLRTSELHRPAPAPAGQRRDGCETAVLIGNQHLDVVGIDRIERHRKPPDPAFGGIGAQQFAVPVDHLARHLGGLFQRRRIGPIQPVKPP